MLKKKIAPYLYIIPGLLILLIFVYYPIFRNIEYSFLKWDLFSGTKKFVKFTNYLSLFRSDEFGVAFKNNILYIIISFIFQVGISVIFASILENMKYKKLSTLFRTTFFLPSLISLTIIGLLFTFIYKTDGLLNSILEVMHLGDFTKGWLGDEKTAIFSIIAVSQWKSTGYTMMLFIVAIQKIPTEINEAAKIDGATRLKTFLHITIPLIKDMIKISTIITISGGLLVFNEIFIMTNGGPYGSSEVLSTIMYKNAFVHGNIGYASAIANVILLLSFVFSALQFITKESDN
ncbi:MAG: sugar ABC transporter permease [Herbinix sp.]|nr:sugar ABC transporter permease [Herbinix sp.]